MRCALIVSLLVVSPVLANWPQWRGELRDGTWSKGPTLDKLPDQLEPRWRKPIGGGYSGIAVRGKYLYTLDYQKKPTEQERILCLDVKTGETVWSHAYDVEYKKMDYGNGPRSTPTLSFGRVYTFGARGHLHCLDMATGKVIWSRDTAKDYKSRIPTWGLSCSPIIWQNNLIVQVGGEGNACLVSFDIHTGKELWRALDDPAGYSSPLLVGGTTLVQLVVSLPEHLVGLNPNSGKENWRYKLDQRINYDVAISDPIYHNGVLLAGDYWTGCRAIGLGTPKSPAKELWKGKQVSLLMSTPLYANGYAYALDRFKGLKCIELKTGEIKWENEHVTPRGRNPHASMVWLKEKALIFNEKCELILARLSPMKYEEISKVQVPMKKGFTWAHPGYGDGCLFVRDDEEILCVSLTR